ncbi:GntR family transcriptional regulator [Cellulomonas sp. SLBN-39]|uniref:GntR family transcriptional regulator n=1 Tax=Cellulomonas sp. SLBN-39 TaxID=2768446 RepID=UPI00114D7BAB|nr:GntR family transcriptional regulator [Cellulomonas sp. SLBN-39]
MPSITVDVDSPVPVYEQIRGQVAGLVQIGVLRGGERLPSVRALASDLGVAVNTVARAYQELQAGGYVVTSRRGGTQVVGSPPTHDLGPVREAAAVLARRARDLGVDADSVHAFVAEAIRLEEAADGS